MLPTHIFNSSGEEIFGIKNHGTSTKKERLLLSVMFHVAEYFANEQMGVLPFYLLSLVLFSIGRQIQSSIETEIFKNFLYLFSVYLVVRFISSLNVCPIKLGGSYDNVYKASEPK